MVSPSPATVRLIPKDFGTLARMKEAYMAAEAGWLNTPVFGELGTKEGLHTVKVPRMACANRSAGRKCWPEASPSGEKRARPPTGRLFMNNSG